MNNTDLTQILNTLSTGVLVSEYVTGIVHHCNESICRYLSFGKKDLIGRNINDIVLDGLSITPEDVSLSKDSLDYGFSQEWSQIKLIDRAGNSKDALAHYNIIDEPRGKRFLLIEVFVGDLNNSIMRQELLESLEREKELGKLKSQFVTTASHQFRTPLTVIQTNMSLIKMHMAGIDIDSKEKLDSLCDRIIYQVGKMTSIMNEILILGKIDSKGINPKFGRVNVIDFIVDMVDKTNLLYHDRAITVTVTGQKKGIMMDAHLFEHALNNLITNAMKYSTGSQDPNVTLEMLEDEFIVTVEDYGVGIPEDDLPRIFEPFFRASNVDAISGTGLGMAIVKEYVELNRGTVSVDSQLNKGTRVVCKFGIYDE